MEERSVIERSIKDAEHIRAGLNAEEQKVFNKIKRSLMKTFINPNYAVKMLIDISAMEYLRYIREMSSDKDSSRIARSIRDTLSELDLTPSSRKSVEVTRTLSQIFQNLLDKHPAEEDTDA